MSLALGSASGGSVLSSAAPPPLLLFPALGELLVVLGWFFGKQGEDLSEDRREDRVVGK